MEASFSRCYIFANQSSHSDYSMMTKTMEQETSAPSEESFPGPTTDPTGTTNKLEQAVDQLNANMDEMSAFLGKLCQRIPAAKKGQTCRLK